MPLKVSDPNLRLKPGDRVFITNQEHPWAAHAGELVAFETYGLGWTGWRVKLDGWCGECYASEHELMGPGWVDRIKLTGYRAVIRAPRKKKEKPCP